MTQQRLTTQYPLLKSLIVSALVATTTLSCGILGDKQDAKRSIALEEEGGCMNALGDQMKRFSDGAISEAEWIGTWSCLEDTLDKFVKLVRPSDPQGFNHADIQGLIKTFLIRGKPVTSRFVAAAFEAKASLMGGSARHFTSAEIAKFRAIIQVIRTETPSMIPHLRNRKVNPTPDHVRPLVDKIALLGVKLAESIDPDGNSTLSKEMAVTFMTELAAMTGGAEYEYQQWGDFLVELKNVLVHGDLNGIAGSDWKRIILLGTELGAAAIGMQSVHEDEASFQLEMAERGRSVLQTMFSRWDGAVPFKQLDKLAQAAPNSLLPKRAGEFKLGVSCAMQRRFDEVPAGSMCPAYRSCPPGSDCAKYPKCPKEGCRPALSRFLGSNREDALGPEAIDTFMDLYRTGMRGKAHLQEIMSGVKGEVTPAQFHALADRYAEDLSSQAKTEVQRLKRIATEYLGLHPDGSKEIVFSDFARHSRQNLTYFNWYEKVAEELLKAYGSSQKPLKGSATDLYFVTKDLELILLSLSMVHPMKAFIHEKRFREANLFTMPGNGDTWMDIKETANYIATLMSISRLSKRIQNQIFADNTPEGSTRPCRPIGEDSCLKIPLYNVQCFRDHFYNNLKDYWQDFPSLWKDFEAMNEKQRQEFIRSYEAASKLSGMYDETDVSSYDVDSYAGVPHYAEALMKKFDNRGGSEDGYLDFLEIQEQVWPTFKTEFKKLTDLPSLASFANKPLFIYLLKYGGLPFKCQKSPQIGEIAAFAGWMAIGGHNQGFKIRRDRMLKIFEELSKPTPEGCKGYLPPAVCKAPTPSDIYSTALTDRGGIDLDNEMIILLNDSLSEEEKAALLQ